MEKEDKKENKSKKKDQKTHNNKNNEKGINRKITEYYDPQIVNPKNSQPEVHIQIVQDMKQEKNLKENEKCLNSNDQDSLHKKYNIEYKYQNYNNLTKLLHITTNENFIFTNQSDYTQIGKYVINYVDDLILKYNMKKLWIPKTQKVNKFSDFEKSNSNQCHIFVSKNFEEKNKKLLLLIQGTGAVRAGIWSRSVCINDSLEKGSVIPFLEYAEKNDYQVMILNPNERYSTNKNSKSGIPIKEFTSMEKHCEWVWKNIIEEFSNSSEIHIVAHSMGGVCTLKILNSALKSKNIGFIKKIAFTDAVHGSSLRYLLDNKDVPIELRELRKVNLV